MLTLEEIRFKLAERFKEEKISSLSAMPHPFELANIKEGSQLIQEAIQTNKHILIVGDYDADGILSTALMVLFFQALGVENFSFVIPNRFKNGYGISIPILERFPQAELIITVDNGITALEVAEYCKEKGKTLIITDHHTPKETLPQALIINPKVSGFIQEEICGAMVAWYFCAGIKATLKAQIDLVHFLELVGIATISDLMPLVDLNRIIVKKMLKLFKSPHFAFSSFLLSVYKKIDEECIGFFIAPLLNASGRMAQAEIALDFLLSQTQEEAKSFFQSLQDLNLERKKIQQETLLKLQDHLILTPYCVIACGEDWNEGILGILASKLAQEHQKSAFVFVKKNGLYQGSGRAWGNVNLIKSLQNLEMLQEFGGHKGAVGIKIHPDCIQDFLQNFIPIQEGEEKEKESFFGEIHPSLLTPALLEILKEFAPYGEGNPKPVFSLPPLPLLSSSLIGKEKNHTLLTFQTPYYKPIKAIAFFCTNLEVDFSKLHFYITQDSFSSSPMLLVKN